VGLSGGQNRARGAAIEHGISKPEDGAPKRSKAADAAKAG
jgi:hypothetical protein